MLPCEGEPLVENELELIDRGPKLLPRRVVGLERALVGDGLRGRFLGRTLPVERILGGWDDFELHPRHLRIGIRDEVEAAEAVTGERVTRAVTNEEGKARRPNVIVLAQANVNRVHTRGRSSPRHVLVEPTVQHPGLSRLGLLELVTQLLDPHHLLLVGEGDVACLDRNRHEVLRLHLQTILVGCDHTQNPRTDESQDGTLESLGTEVGPEAIGRQADDRRVAEVPRGSHRVLADLFTNENLDLLPDPDLPGKHQKGDEVVRNGMIFG